jgi:hypothetical protein
MSIRLLVAVTTVVVIGAMLPTSAPALAHADVAPAAKSEARERFALGLRLFEKGENAPALAEFKRAYELVPNPLVLYNIGLVYAAMDRPVEAVDALDEFLKAGGKVTAGEPGQRAKRVRDEQSKRIAQIMVVTNKPATIEIDGVEAGRTPLEQPLRLASGAHVVSVLASGCLPLRQEVTLAGQVTQTLNLTLLPTESNVAHLVLTVSVPGAEVSVNGKSAGLTPLAASVAVPPGGATIEVRRQGYRPVSRTVHLDEGSSGSMTLSLEEDPSAPASVKGRLRLTASEPGAEVTVDGVARPGASDGVPLLVGPHLVRVQRGGFVPFERQVDVAAGGDTALFVNLVPTPETRLQSDDSARARRIWGMATIGAGALLTVGAGVYAIATRNAVSDAQRTLNGQLALEAIPTEHCFLTGPSYDFWKCGETKAAYQDDLDSAKLKRGLAFAGIAVGAAAAGVGAYLLMSGDANRYTSASDSHVSLWSDGHAAGLIAAGRF